MPLLRYDFHEVSLEGKPGVSRLIYLGRASYSHQLLVQVLEKVERETKEGRRRAEKERLERDKVMRLKRDRLRETFLRQQAAAIRASKSSVK